MVDTRRTTNPFAKDKGNVSVSPKNPGSTFTGNQVSASPLRALRSETSKSASASRSTSPQNQVVVELDENDSTSQSNDTSKLVQGSGRRAIRTAATSALTGNLNSEEDDETDQEAETDVEAEPSSKKRKTNPSVKKRKESRRTTIATYKVTPRKPKPNQPARIRRRWSELEEDALRRGIAKYGLGQWSAILRDPEFSFNERIAVDLKDKYRVMLHKKMKESTNDGKVHVACHVAEVLDVNRDITDPENRLVFKFRYDRDLKASWQSLDSVSDVSHVEPLLRDYERLLEMKLRWVRRSLQDLEKTSTATPKAVRKSDIVTPESVLKPSPRKQSSQQQERFQSHQGASSSSQRRDFFTQFSQNSQQSAHHSSQPQHHPSSQSQYSQRPFTQQESPSRRTPSRIKPRFENDDNCKTM